MQKTQAQIEFGVAVTNIAGNIEVLLPQLANRGAEVAIVGNEIHGRLIALRQLGKDFQDADPDTLTEQPFEAKAEEIAALLPQLGNHGAEVEAVAKAISGYLSQLVNVHAQHLHLIPGADPKLIVAPHVNNGLGAAPFNTGTGIAVAAVDTSKTDPNPKPAGDGQVAAVVADEPVTKVELV